MGAILADGQTLSLGKSDATQMVFSPSDTPSDEKISLTNTAGTAADAIAVTSTAGSITLTADSATSAVVIKGDHESGNAVHIDANQAAASILIEAGTLDVDSTAAITLDAGAASNLTTSSGSLTLAGAGGVTVTSTGGAMSLGAGQTVTRHQQPLM